MLILFFLQEAATQRGWFESNVAWIISLAVLTGSGIIWAVRQEGRLNQVMAQLEKMDKDQSGLLQAFNDHVRDTDMHVNHLYMRGMEQKIDKLETSVEKLQGTMDKFDQSFAKMDELLRKD